MSRALNTRTYRKGFRQRRARARVQAVYNSRLAGLFKHVVFQRDTKSKHEQRTRKQIRELFININNNGFEWLFVGKTRRFCLVRPKTRAQLLSN